MPLGSPLDLGMAGQYVQGEEGTKRLVGLMDTFTQLGGNLLTISVADSETLRDAQKHPENYKDLRVRMGGWSAYFTMLSKEQQEHHIKKSEMCIRDSILTDSFSFDKINVRMLPLLLSFIILPAPRRIPVPPDAVPP